jgi:hypothetical protein
MKRKKHGPRCRDCGARCDWKQTKDGRFALWDRRKRDWHWWGCPKQAKLRKSYLDQREREAACVAAAARDIDPAHS